MSYDLFTELREKLDEMQAETRAMGIAGHRLGRAERDYRVALAKKELELRAGGMPATITQDIAKGNETIAELRMARDIAKTDWEVCKQRLFMLSLHCKIIDAQLSREWRAS